jgi:hypothetical protein
MSQDEYWMKRYSVLIQMQQNDFWMQMQGWRHCHFAWSFDIQLYAQWLGDPCFQKTNGCKWSTINIVLLCESFHEPSPELEVCMPHVGGGILGRLRTSVCLKICNVKGLRKTSSKPIEIKEDDLFLREIE